MDVTRLSGASRAAESRAPAARSTGPAFESFLPSAGEADARPAAGRDADRIARAERQRSESQRQADTARRAEERRAEDRRAEERRAADRRAEERQAEDRELEQQRAADAEQRRAEERRAEERRAEQRRAEQIEAREAADAQALSAQASLPTDVPSAASRSPEAALGGDRLGVVQPDRADIGLDGSAVAIEGAGADPASPEFGLAAAPGVQSLVQWLQSRPDIIEGPRAQRALELARAEGSADASGSDPTVDAKAAMVDGAEGPADPDPTAELTRLLEGRKLAGDLLEPGGRETTRRGDSVRIGPQAQGAQPQGPHIGPGLTPLSPTAQIADSAAASRAGSTPTALPAGVDESSIMRQISNALRLEPGRAGRPQTAEIQLHPAELGRVRVRIHMEAGTARVEVAAEHAGVTDLLASGLDQLRRDLMAQGVHVAHLEVRSGLADEGGQRREAPEHDEADEPEPTAEVEPRITGRKPRGRIDVEA